MFRRLFQRFSADHRAIPIGIKLIVLVMFLRSVGWGFIDPFYPFYLEQFHANYTLIGLLSSIIWIASLLTIIPLMRLTDRVRETTLIHDGEVIYMLTILFYMLAGYFLSLPLLVVALLLNGVGHTLMVVGSEAYIRKHNPKGESKPFAYYTTSDYLGWVLGMIGAAFLIPYYHFNNMFWFVVPSILVGLFILPHIRERGLRSVVHGFKKYFHTSGDFLAIFSDLKTLNLRTFFFLLISFFDGGIRMFVYIFIPLFGLSIDMPLSTIALLMAVMYLPYAFSFFMSEITSRFHQLTTIATGLFVGAGSFILLFFIVHQTWILLLVSLTSLSMALIRPAYNGAISRLTPRRLLGEITSLNHFVERIGRILGPIITGLVADRFGIPSTFLFVAVVAFLLGGLSLILKLYYSPHVEPA
ncbi:MFS transporter [Candidatus Peregrinibacteria bacterium]|nr:MAG: MFS transporter [Candidatus Peregrinibacteria bacterium]